MRQYDYIIVGSGIAGLYTALLARQHGSVLIVTKGSIDDCNTKYAQGGIAAAIGKTDSPGLHFQDTVAAGDGLCDEEAVRILVDEAPDRISELVNLGVTFDTIEGEIALAMEAAHSVPRIVHAGGDATGEHLEVTLSNQVSSARIKVLEDCLAIAIVVEGGAVSGIMTLDSRTGKTEELGCRFLILATGGAGQLFRFNTNSRVATGDGIALAFEAGAEIVDMEFFQFHPTALRLPGATPFLISEAVRGEGGVLLNREGRRFMSGYASQGELAPRDVVARAITYEMSKTGSDNVFLDITHLPARVITSRFPQIYRFCLRHGLDITREPIPVAPAAHYMTGGVKVNTWGETSIAGLFAAGETACTGVHGANRLASNSLMEVVVFGKRIVEKAGQGGGQSPVARSGADVRQRLPRRPLRKDAPPPGLSALQHLHWEKTGIIRDRARLAEAAGTLATWQETLPLPADRASHELRNLVVTGRLLAEAALLREESRGAHFRSDFPRKSAEWQRHIILTGQPGGGQ
ncbi:MAG: L-aspartate oxidase [Chloroflexi bacterium]|nr:L-aspartate oxidase [Chloroflexota bacterium]